VRRKKRKSSQYKGTKLKFNRSVKITEFLVGGGGNLLKEGGKVKED